MRIEKGAKFPPVEGCYKMIQLELDGDKYFVFGFSTHEKILEKHLQDKGIEFEYIEKYNKQIPSSSGTRYRVVGMGRCEIVPSRKLAFFSDQSIDFELAVSKEYVDLLRTLNSDWKITILDEKLASWAFK